MPMLDETGQGLGLCMIYIWAKNKLGQPLLDETGPGLGAGARARAMARARVRARVRAWARARARARARVGVRVRATFRWIGAATRPLDPILLHRRKIEKQSPKRSNGCCSLRKDKRLTQLTRMLLDKAKGPGLFCTSLGPHLFASLIERVGKKIKRATGVCTFRAQAAFKAI